MHRISMRVRENSPEGMKHSAYIPEIIYTACPSIILFREFTDAPAILNKVRRFLNRGRVYIIKKVLMRVPSTGGSSVRRLILEFGNKKNRMWQRCLIAYEALWGAKIASYL